MLSDDSRGIRWDGLPLAVELYGVTDVAGLIERLIVIKTWRKPEDGAGSADH